MSKLNIVVTGGAGFIGSHLCERLIAEGNRVICLDNMITGRIENLAPVIKNSRFSIEKRDVSKSFKLEGKVDQVYHMASPASPVDYLNYPIQTLKVGSLGTHNALGFAKHKSARLLLASTSEVYGDPLEHPQKETYWGNVNPIGPRGVYDEAKRFSEAITLAYHRVHCVDTKIVRIFNTYGPRMRKNDGRAVPNFMMQALEDKPLTIFGRGTQTRSFCYVNDLVEGIIRLMASDLNVPVNIGNPHEVTLLEIARLIIKLTRSKSGITFQRLPKDDPQKRKPDIARARRYLKWKPLVSLNQVQSLSLKALFPPQLHS